MLDFIFVHFSGIQVMLEIDKFTHKFTWIKDIFYLILLPLTNNGFSQNSWTSLQ